MQSPPFRRDIQGLRGLAVLLVVLFPAGTLLTGGFVGVDVFFVISGFLIGGILLRELDATGTILADAGTALATRSSSTSHVRSSLESGRRTQRRGWAVTSSSWCSTASSIRTSHCGSLGAS